MKKRGVVLVYIKFKNQKSLPLAVSDNNLVICSSIFTIRNTQVVISGQSSTILLVIKQLPAVNTNKQLFE